MRIRIYYMLTKPGIVFGNAVTAAGGFALGSGRFLDLWLLSSTLLGLSFIVASGCVLNNYFDRVSDQKMARTRTRALARKAISEKNALLFGLTLLILGGAEIAFLTNWLATLIALLGFIVYVGFYTIWKYRTVYGTEIGSIAGAVPPVVGYCSSSGQFDLAASLLFIIVALWQMPHFFAIALYRIEEYASASIPVLPLKKGVYVTKLRMVFYLLAFIVASTLPTIFRYTGYWYLAVIFLLGISWFWICLQGFQSDQDKRWARQMFLSSLVVILGFCAMIFLDRNPLQIV